MLVILVHTLGLLEELLEVFLLVHEHFLLLLLVARSLHAWLVVLLEVSVKRPWREHIRRSGLIKKHPYFLLALNLL